jgi:uncharacterized BrkB/YihY/UPF0761 family membrane protein
MNSAAHRQGGPKTSATREAASSPIGLGRQSWWEAVKRTGSKFRDDNLTDLAAALT